MGTSIGWRAAVLGALQVLAAIGPLAARPVAGAPGTAVAGATETPATQGQEAAPTPAQAVLRVGVSGDYPPFASRDAQETLGGFELYVADRLGRDMNAQVQVVSFTWPALAADLNKGAFDVAMSGVTLRADRALEMSFTRPYAVGGAVVVLRRADAARLAKVDDVNRPGINIGVNAGGHLERVARAQFPKASLVTINDNTELLNRLRDKTCDAVVSDSFEASTWPATEIVVRGPFTRDHKVYALRRTAVGLRRRVNDWLAAREADGWLNEQRRRHLGDGAVLTERQAAAEALLAAITLRLQLMPYVAAVKRRDGVAIEDQAQEKRVLDQVRAAAVSEGLDPGSVSRLFEALIAAAKAVEHSTSAPPAMPSARLADLRQTIAGASDQIVAELNRLARTENTPKTRQDLQRLLGDQMRRQGLTPELAERIATSAAAVAVAAPTPAK